MSCNTCHTIIVNDFNIVLSKLSLTPQIPGPFLSISTSKTLIFFKNPKNSNSNSNSTFTVDVVFHIESKPWWNFQDFWPCGSQDKKSQIFCFLFCHMPECFSTLWNSIDEVLCATKIEKSHIYVGLQVEIMQNIGHVKKKSTTFL
jgi:hypothetical protein